MAKQFKKWMLRLTATVLLCTGMLVIIVMNPLLTYAEKTEGSHVTIFHHKPLDPYLKTRLQQADEFLRKSEIYHANMHVDLCLNDGSVYPKIMKALRGPAFAWGFFNKVVMQGNANWKENHVELNGYKWDLAQLLAHEMTHCMQFRHAGFWNSNPAANIPLWKWEGYAEYVSRQTAEQKDLIKNLERLEKADSRSWDIRFDDGTMAPREYYEYWNLVQFCLDIKKMRYDVWMADTTAADLISSEMKDWYKKVHKR